MSKIAPWVYSKELMGKVEFYTLLAWISQKFINVSLGSLFLLKQYFDNILYFPDSLYRFFLKHIFSRLIAFQFSPLGEDELIILEVLSTKNN